MKFSEEYKKSAENMSPDRQTIDRMKAAVLKELREHPNVPALPLEEPKKPLPLRRLAFIGGAVAACAVITVAAVNILPSLKTSNGMIATGAAESSMAIAAEDTAINSTPETSKTHSPTLTDADDDIAEDAPADEAADYEVGSDFGNNDCAGTCGTNEMHNPGFAPSEILSDQTFDEAPAENDPDIYDNGQFTEPTADSKSEGFVTATDIAGIYTEETDYDDDCTCEAQEDSIEEPYPTTDCSFEATEEMYAATEEICAATEEICVSEECSTEESSDDGRGNPTTGGSLRLVISPQGWLTCDGIRFDITDAPAPADAEYKLVAYSPIDKRSYRVIPDGDMLYLYDWDMNYLGGYKKR